MLDDGSCLGSVTGENATGEVRAEACIWQPNGARVALQPELASHYQRSLPGWQLTEIHDASPDGLTLTGDGLNPSGVREFWILQLSEALPLHLAQPSVWAWQNGEPGSVTGQELKFPSQLIGTEMSMAIQLGNRGDVPLQITGLTFQGDQAAEFKTSFTVPQTIAVGQGVNLWVTFKPQSVGRKTATFSVQSNDPETPAFQINLIGSGPAPHLTLKHIRNSAAHSLETLALKSILGRSIEARLSLTNEGNAAATGITAEILEASVPGLELLTPIPATLGVRAEAFFNVRYTPVAAGTGTAGLRFQYDHPEAPLLTLPITTEAIAEPWQYSVTREGNITVSNDAALPDFGQVTVGALMDQVLTLTNTDSRVLDRVEVRFEGEHAEDFIYSWNGSLSALDMESGATRRLFVMLRPTASGVRNARLVLDAPGRWPAPHVIHLTGVGVAVGELQFASYPAAEINTTTLNEARFRVLGAASVKYRLCQGNTPVTEWRQVNTEATVYLKGEHQGYGFDYSIDLQAGSTVVRGPLFHRAKVKRHLASLTIIPGTSTPIRCDIDASASRLEYQWLKDGVELTDGGSFDNAREQTLVVHVKDEAEKGSYQCRVTLRSPSGVASAVTEGTTLDLVKLPQVVPFSFRPSRVLERPSITFRATDQEFAPTTFTITGLPPGIKQVSKGSDQITGQILPAAASKGPREYVVTVIATNAVGQGSPFQATWLIEPFDTSVAGTYHAFLERNETQDGGRGLGGSLTVTVTRAGQFSGSLLIAGRARGITGQIVSAPPDDLPSSFPYPLPSGMTTEATPPIGLSKQFFLDKNNPAAVGFGIEGNVLAGVLVDYNGRQSMITGMRRLPAPASLLYNHGKKGVQHFALDILPPATPVYFPLPEGNGFFAFTIEASGIVKWTGRLADSTVFTGSSGLSMFVDGDEVGWSAPLHTTLYNRRGSIQGLLAFPEGSTVAGGVLDWNKTELPRDPVDRLYSSIPLTSLIAAGSPYVYDKKIMPLLHGQFDVTSKIPNGTFTLTAGHLAHDEVVIPMRLENSGRITLTTEKGGTIPKFSLSLVPATGLFKATGQYSIEDPNEPSRPKIVRTVTGHALWIPHLLKGVGTFTLLEATNLDIDPPITPRNALIHAGQIFIEGSVPP
ncbi:MAG TPA: hypothetical protein DCP71_15850 [Verrucomicrobiales bacterium]|nr:hypothetical protein [Verrucomicrobiales bacterium]